MNENTFLKQTGRLQARWGKQIFCDEMVRLMWKHLKSESDYWMESTVDYFIGTSRQAPLLTEFQQKQSEERERQWDSQKHRHKKDAEEFMNFVPLVKEESNIICEAVRKLITGQLNEDDRRAVLKMVENFKRNRSAHAADRESSLQRINTFISVDAKKV